jgi:hypothetical protein
MTEHKSSNPWVPVERIGQLEVRPYVHGDQARHPNLSISDADLKLPTLVGGMIARNPDNHEDMWYIARDYFNKHYRIPVETSAPRSPIAWVVVAENGGISSSGIYAPGLPEGTHDLYYWGPATARMPSPEISGDEARFGSATESLVQTQQAKCAIDKTCLEYPRCRCGTGSPEEPRAVTAQQIAPDHSHFVCPSCGVRLNFPENASEPVVKQVRSPASVGLCSFCLENPCQCLPEKASEKPLARDIHKPGCQYLSAPTRPVALQPDCDCGVDDPLVDRLRQLPRSALPTGEELRASMPHDNTCMCADCQQRRGQVEATANLPACECLLLNKAPSAYHAPKCPRYVADLL